MSSCSSSRSIPDYSKSALEPLLAIKGCLESSDIDSFNVEIENRWGGVDVVTANIEKNSKGVKLDSQTMSSSGRQTDTVLFFPDREFLERIDYEIEVSDMKFSLAGVVQNIKITYNNTSEVFYTKRGLGLLSLLQKGESNTVKNLE